MDPSSFICAHETPRLAFVWTKHLIWGLLIIRWDKCLESPERYLTFLLPNEKLEIAVSPSQNLSDTDIVIQWFSTSIGGISLIRSNIKAGKEEATC